MGGKPRPKTLATATDVELVNALTSRGYALKPPQSKKDREMSVDLTNINTGETRHMRKLELLVPEGSPLWWPKE